MYKSVDEDSLHSLNDASKNLQKQSMLTGKHYFRNLFLNKVAGLQQPATLKRKSWIGVSLLIFEFFKRTPILQNTCF